MTGKDANSDERALNRRRYLKIGVTSTAIATAGCLRLSGSSTPDGTATGRPTETSGLSSTGTPRETAESTPTTTPEETPQTTPENPPEDTPEATPEETPEETPTETPSDESESEYTAVRGSIDSAAGVSLEGYQVEIFNRSNRNFYKLKIRGGQFTQTVAADSELQLTFFHKEGDYISTFDGVPLLYALSDGIAVSGQEEDIGSFELPQAYRTEIRFVDPDGNPVENFPVGFRASNGSGTTARPFTTNAEGYAKFADESQTGIDLAGTVTIEGGRDSASATRLREITVTEASEYTITVIPDRYET
jgi:hypothetical protein